MGHDARTRDYVTRRTSEGRTKREIMRSLKRYISRQLFRTLNSANAAIQKHLTVIEASH
jgi:hypothetical protein